MKILKLQKRCKKTDSNLIIVLLRFAWYKAIHQKSIIAHQRAFIKGADKITVSGMLDIGVGFVRFMHRKDITYLNIGGKMEVGGDYSIGRGCRIDVDGKATLAIGKGGYLNANTKVIVMHEVKIGDDCAISWDCQILDEDFHQIEYEGKKVRPPGVEIGNNVWIGCNTYIYSGVRIAEGTVVAANSVVRGVFDKPNVLIAGNPAKVVKQNVQWSL